ncbi:LacI family DNA-binding transcriptional regulator [Streptomyces canus]|uniref:LacI family DNA-binding transcriptional regulator n=1 Tax=Streptomyces canus TaxID=58343 RepID=UPI002E27D4BC|nr:LacI family DNA-binding transcriptional regulator [Streptomyces canus]
MHVTGHTSFGCQTAPSPGRCGPAGIRDVAQAAGVSYPTVSRVGNGRPNGKEETRGRVEAAVRAPGFRRDATAFALTGGVTRAVAVLTSNTVLHGCAATPRDLEETSRSAGYAHGVRVVTPEDDLDRTIAAAADTGGGLVVVGSDRLGAAVLDGVPAHVPCAAPVRRRRLAGPGWADDREAARTTTERLLGLGHETVHYAALPVPRSPPRPGPVHGITPRRGPASDRTVPEPDRHPTSRPGARSRSRSTGPRAS